MANDLNELLNSSREAKIDYIYDNYAKQFDLARKDAQAFYEFLSRLARDSNLAQLHAATKNTNLSMNQRMKAERDLEDERLKLANKAAIAVKNINDKHHKESIASQTAQSHRNNAEKIANARRQAKEQYEFEYELAKAQDKKGKDLARITRAYKAEDRRLAKEQDKEILAAINQQRAARDEANKAADAQSQTTSKKQKDGAKAIFNEFKKGSEEGIKGMTQLGLGAMSAIGNFSIDNLADSFVEKAKASKAELEQTQAEKAELEALNSNDPEILAKIEELNEKEAELTRKAIIDGNNAALAKAAAAIGNAINDSYKQAFSSAETFLTSNSARLTSRLDGTNENFKSLTQTITSKLSVSPYVKVSQVLDNMKKAVEEGIAYNIESRAFLGTVSDKIAHTFDAFDSNLTRLIKLQQQDSTAARLGMEAALNKFLNKQFSDSSYLNNLADSVSGAIIEANSQLARNQSAEFEYIVQKWLGSLSSVGVSDETITSIAEGINYIATGNVQSLSSNTQLQTLFAMSAANANLEYSELLLEGLDASNTNKLLQSMVLYLKEIAEGSDNQVVKAAYGDILNLKLSDMTALSNLSTSDIANIAGNSMSYSNMISNTQSQLSSLISRTSLPEMLSNVYDNVVYSVANDMVNNPVTWAMQKMLNFMDSNEIDINIPSISAAGFGVDLETSVGGLMRMGLGIAQAFSLMSNIVQGLGSGGGTDLSDWEIKDSISRGSGNRFQLSTILGGTSNSTSYATNMNKSDVTNSSLSQATDDAENTKEITNKNQPDAELVLDDYVKMVVGDEASSWLRTKDIYIEASYISGVNALRTWDTHLKRIAANNLNSDYLATHDPIAVKQLSSIFGNKSLIGSAGSVPTNDVLYVHDNVTGTKVDNVNTSIGSNYTLISTILGSESLLDDENALRVHDDSASTLLSSLATAFSSSTVKIDNSLEEPLYVYVTNHEDMKAVLDIEANNVKIEIDTTVITDALKKALGTDKGTNAQDAVLASQIANAIASKALMVTNKTGSTLEVKVNNFPSNGKW